MDQKYTQQQLVAATLNHYNAIYQLRVNLLGEDFNDRHLAAFLLLGARHMKELTGAKTEPMTKGRLEDLIARRLGVDSRTAHDDLKMFIEEKLVEFAPNGDARTKVLVLSEKGKSLYQQFAEQSASIILNTAKTIFECKAIYIHPHSEAASHYKDFTQW